MFSFCLKDLKLIPNLLEGHHKDNVWRKYVVENFACLEVMAPWHKLFKMRAWKDYGLHLCLEAGALILTSGLFLYVITSGLCIKMKNVVRIGTGTLICLFADKYPHHWTYRIIHIYLFPLKYFISLEHLSFSSQGRKYYPIHPVL